MGRLDFFRDIYVRLTAGGSTEQQAVQSGIWVAGINIGDRVLQILKVIILARLLSPAAFGLLGIALLSIAALRQFSKLGFDEAMIQHEDENVDAYLNTAWVIKIVRGVVIAVVAFLAAPHLAVFFEEPQARLLIQVIGFSPLILGLQNPAVMYFQKNLNFHREFIYQVGGRLVDLVVATTIALIFQSVWALAAGIITMNLMKSGLSYFIHKYRPSIEFNLDYAEEMFGFGKWMFASAILVFLYSQADDAFVGWFFTATSLGFYQIAYRFSNAPATEITHVISRVAFPALSKVQNDTDSLRNGYLSSVQMSTILAFPMAAGIASVSPQFVRAVLGNQWEPMVPLMQLLAVWGGVRAFGANVGPVFKSTGRPDVEVKLQALKTLSIAIMIYPAAKAFGLLGVVAAIIGSSLIVQPIALYYMSSIVELKILKLIKIVIYPFTASIVMAVCVISVNSYILTGFGLVELFIQIGTGIVLYASIMFIFEMWTDYEFVYLYKTVQKSF